MTDTSPIDYKALYEQVVHEYEEYRLETAKFKLGSINPEIVKYAVKKVIGNPYFWIGYVTAIVAMLLIGAYHNLKD